MDERYDKLLERMHYAVETGGRLRPFFEALADAYENGEISATLLDEICVAYLDRRNTYPNAAKVMAAKIKRRKF